MLVLYPVNDHILSYLHQGTMEFKRLNLESTGQDHYFAIMKRFDSPKGKDPVYVSSR